ncbi:hypothetical protein AVEN_79229-1 [Araneus ventricosus]|uniref:Uncharacterized protein n=1 Tax=Araneus ventricosus TaxID=182803 RepID=A0A4Y2K8G6_ARAVE|nr:hypothetical protein AVEN_79229-1 [Araneus ventricosus]
MRSLIVFVTLLALTSSAQGMLGLEYGPSLGKLYGQHGLELKKILGAEKAIAWPHLYYYPILAKEKEHEIGFGKELGLEKGMEYGKKFY